MLMLHGQLRPISPLESHCKESLRLHRDMKHNKRHNGLKKTNISDGKGSEPLGYPGRARENKRPLEMEEWGDVWGLGSH